jgi:hypothetical protein
MAFWSVVRVFLFRKNQLLGVIAMEKSSTIDFDRKFAIWIIKYRVVLVIAILLVSSFFAFRFAGLKIITRLEDFAPQGHPYVKVQRLMEKWFQGGNMIQIMLEVKEGTILKAEVLEKLLRINREVLFLEGVISARVHSIADKKVKMTKGDPEGWIARRLMSMVPRNEEEEETLRMAILGDDLLYGKLISKDLKAALIRAEFKEDVEYHELFSELMKIKAEEDDETVDIHISGRPVMLGWIDYYQVQLLPVFLLAFLIMAVLLYAAFRSIRGVVLPLLSAFISVVWGMGILGVLGFQLDPMASIVPFIILGIGVSHSVQVIQRYFEECRKGKSSKDAAEEVATVLFKPLFTSIVTDGFAFLTMIAVNIKLLKILALCGSLSILSILFNIHILLPALLSFMPTPRKEKAERAGRSVWLNWLLTKIAIASTNTRGAWLLVGGFAVLLIFGVLGTVKMQIGGRAPGAGAFYEDSPYAKQTRAIGRKFAGAVSYNLVIEGKEPNDIQHPAVMQDMEKLQEFLNMNPRVGDSLSLADYVKRMNVVVHGGDERLYYLPRIGSPELGFYEDTDRVKMAVGEDLFIYSMGTCGEFDFIVDYEYRKTNIQVFLKDMEANTIRNVIRDTKDFVANNWKSDNVKVHIAGGLAGVVGAINEELSAGMIENMVQISLIVFIFCVVLLRSVVGALIVVVSLFTRVIIVYGVMGFVPIPLTLYTMPVASLGIGIGVDYVIYVLVRIQEEYANKSGGDIQQATINALTTTGKAVFYTTMSVVLGVMVFFFSPLKFQFELGSMIGLIIFLNGLGAIALISPIVFLIKPKFIFKQKK